MTLAGMDQLLGMGGGNLPAVVTAPREETTVANRALELEAAERQKLRGEISNMVSERPDEVAAMLRGWLTENKS